MPDRTLRVKIIGDDTHLRRTFQRDRKEAQGFAASLNEIGKFARGGALGAGGKGLAGGLLFGSAAFIGTAAVTRTLKNAVSAASDLNEEVNKSSEVFGANAKEVEDWGQTTASAFGISEVAALQAANQFGNLFHSVHVGAEASAEMSKHLVELAADMASFNNADPSDVLEALRSGIVGQARPLRIYGVLLSEARVQSEAMAETGKKNAKELTNQEKILARYNIILRDTSIQQGDFGRTSGGLANQTRILHAQMHDLSVILGKAILPELLTLTQLATGATKALLDLSHVKVPGGGQVGSLFGWISGWKELDYLVKHSLFAPQKGKEPTVFDFMQARLGESFGKLEKALDLAASRAKRRDVKNWNEFVKGMGLKLDKAQITESTDDDLQALRILERAIHKRIAAEGHTFVLVSQLTQVRKQIADILQGRAQDAAQAASDAFNESLGLANLSLDKAKITRGFNDDLAALRTIEGLLLKQIQQEGRTADLLSQLFANRQEQAQVLRDKRDAAQFEELGLTATGEKPTPSTRALLHRTRSLERQFKAAGLDTSKLKQIENALVKHFKDMGKNVRAAILDMLNEISNALDSKDKPQGPLTKFAKTGIGKLIAGLGLTVEQERILRARMAAVGKGGSIPGTGIQAFGMTVGAGNRVGPALGPREQDFVFHIYIDGHEVESTVTRRQQRTQGRNARSRRGVRPGR